MDRLAITLIAFGLVTSGVGFARGRDALTVRAHAAAREARVATARRDLDRLQAMPADAHVLPAIAHTLALLDGRMFARPTPLEVRAELDPGLRNDKRWDPLTGEPLKVTIETNASPLAAVEWLELEPRRQAIGLHM